MTDRDSTISAPSLEPRLVGVHIRSRDEYWQDNMDSVLSAREALGDGEYLPERFRAPAPRAVPVFERADGSMFVRVPTEKSFEERPYRKGASAELVATGAFAGGFLPLSQAPLCTLGGRRVKASDWTAEYLGRLPGHTDSNNLQTRLKQGSDKVSQAASQGRSPGDEWAQDYFEQVREIAAGRNQLCESGNARPQGASFFAKNAAWDQDEYHQAAFKEMREAAEKFRFDTKDALQACPPQAFVPKGASDMIAFAAELQKNGSRPASEVFKLFHDELSKNFNQGLQKWVDGKLKAMLAKGGPLHGLQKTFDVISKFNQTGATALVAGMLDKLIFPTEPSTGKPNPVNMDLLTRNFIDKLSAFGIGQGMTALLGKKGGAVFSALGLPQILGESLGDLLRDGEIKLSDDVKKLVDNLPNAAVDQAIDALIGKVDDKSPMIKQFLAKYKDQVKDLLKKLLSKDGLAELQKKWESMWKNAESKATVRLGLAQPMGGAGLVTLMNPGGGSGLPVTRLLDNCSMIPVPDYGKFFQGNPTVLINGMPAAGEIHAAIGALGTIATPMNLAPTVLMGETTITVNVKVKAEAPKAEGGSAGSGRGSAKGAGQGGKGGKTSGQKEKPDVVGPKPQMNDQQRQEYQDMQRRDSELARKQSEAFDRADRGEITPQEAQAEADRIQKERGDLANQMDDMRRRFDPSDFDSDGYLNQKAQSTSDIPPSDPNAQQPQAEPTSNQPKPDPAELARLKRDIRRMGGMSDLAALSGQEKLAESYAAAADAARLRLAYLEGGSEAAKREAEIIGVRRSVEKAIDKGLDFIPPGPTRKIAEWAKLPIGSGMGQLSEEAAKWLQKHGYM